MPVHPSFKLTLLAATLCLGGTGIAGSVQAQGLDTTAPGEAGVPGAPGNPVENTAADDRAPTISLAQPAEGESLSAGEQRFTGAVGDEGGSGVQRVFYVVKRLPLGDYVQPDGTTESPRVLRDAELTGAGGDVSGWRVDTSLPAGEYRLYASAVDATGNTTWWQVRQDVTVTGANQPPDSGDNPPPVEVENPPPVTTPPVSDGNSVFVATANDIVDPASFYQQDGYETVDLLRVDVTTRTTSGTCTEEDDGGCTLGDVLADVDGDDEFTVDIPVKITATDFPDDGLDVNAGLRQRGASTRTAPQKSFRVRLEGDAGLWRNEQRLQLNKHPYDQSRLLNKLSFDLMARVPHLPSLRTQFVNLWVDDGEGPVDQGLYTHVEAAKKEYLINRGRDKDDNLYKADFFLFSEADLAEMAIDANGEPVDADRFERRLEIERGDDHRTLIEMIRAVNDPDQPFQAVFDRYFNRNNVLMWLSVNRLLGQQDVGSQNYYLYNPKGSETFYFLPWDYDGAFQTEPPLVADAVDFESLRNRQSHGFARDGQSVFLDRFLRLPGIHETLVAAGREVRGNWLTNEAMRSLTDAYTPVVRPLVARAPDIANIGGIRRPERMNVWDERIASLPGIVANNLTELERSPAMPLAPVLKEPFQRDERTVLTWTPAYEVTGGTLRYDLQVASSPDFGNEDIVYSETGIADAPGAERVEAAVDLPAGDWFYRIQARTTDPQLYQVADNRILIDRERYIGVRRFRVEP